MSDKVNTITSKVNVIPPHFDERQKSLMKAGFQRAPTPPRRTSATLNSPPIPLSFQERGIGGEFKKKTTFQFTQLEKTCHINAAKKKQIARKLRRRQTHAEKLLWERLRNRKFLGKKFLRQHPIKVSLNGKEKILIADFYCHEARLVIEVDGVVHLTQQEKDANRDYLMRIAGLHVLRVLNEELELDVEAVLKEQIQPLLG